MKGQGTFISVFLKYASNFILFFGGGATFSIFNILYVKRQMFVAGKMPPPKFHVSVRIIQCIYNVYEKRLV